MSGTFSCNGIGLPLLALVGIFLVLVTDYEGSRDCLLFFLFPVLNVQSMK